MLAKAWEALKCLLTRMMDSTDATADSVVVCGVGALGLLLLLLLGLRRIAAVVALLLFSLLGGLDLALAVAAIERRVHGPAVLVAA